MMHEIFAGGLTARFALHPLCGHNSIRTRINLCEK